MRKWVKILVGSAVGLGLIAAGVGAGEWILVRRRPAWYAPDHTTAEQRRTAARGVEDTLVRLHDWSAERSGPAGTAPTPESTYPLSFTDVQLDAFYDKWVAFQDRRSTVERYVHAPRVIVQDGQVIVAGEVREVGLVVSLFVQPAVSADDGRLKLTLAKVVAGVVPVPDSFFATQRAALERTLSGNLPADQRAARLDRDGLANGAAADAAMDELLLAMLRGRPAEPVIFVPVDTSATSRLLPVRITAVTAEHHTLGMTAQAMSMAERRELLGRIKAADPAAVPAPAP